MEEPDPVNCISNQLGLYCAQVSCFEQNLKINDKVLKRVFFCSFSVVFFTTLKQQVFPVKS